MRHPERPFEPFISADKILPELTWTSVISGIILALIFGAVNAYLGLKIGMTISASIPAAVVSMSITRIIMKRDSILENNIVQTIGSAGESLAAGAIFTIPAMFLWAESSNISTPTISFIILIGLLGGVLGVLFMIPLRKALIVKEHGSLPYPEGAACANVLLAAEEEGGAKAKASFMGMGYGALYKLFSDGLHLFPSRIEVKIPAPFKTLLGIDALPALLGVGFIVGRRISGYMLAGSLIGWWIIIPLIYALSPESAPVIFPASAPISTLTPWDVWGYYIRYIGAGAVAFGGLLSLIKSLPLIYETFYETLKDYCETLGEKSTLRTDRDIPISTVGIMIFFILLAMVALPNIKIGLLGALFIIVFGFFFATVSSRIVGLVGSSSNPISGMTIATLILAATAFKIFMPVNPSTIFTVFSVGSIICIIVAMAGDTSQDLKTGFLVGATPYKQQIGEIIGVVSTALVLGGVLTLLHKAWGFGSSELPAPQATLVKLVVEGVMQGHLPWTLILVGACFGLVLELLELPILPVAIGLYLPLHLTGAIYIGGLIRGMLPDAPDAPAEYQQKLKFKIDSGVLFSSGLIAGEGLIGILLALLAVLKINTASGISFSRSFTLVLFSGLVFLLFRWSVFKRFKANT